MSPNFIQEQLSWAYVRAVIFRAGLSLSLPVVDDHGIDGTIVDPNRRGVHNLDFQLKSDTDYTLREADIAYDLRVADYNRLIRDDSFPRILVLFLMPENPDEWLAQSADELCLRKCAYWLSLMGEPPSANTSTRRVFVPLANVFSCDGLHDMFRRLIEDLHDGSAD